jgi:hypothetical protein
MNKENTSHIVNNMGKLPKVVNKFKHFLLCYELNATEKITQQQILQFLIKEKQLLII